MNITKVRKEEDYLSYERSYKLYQLLNKYGYKADTGMYWQDRSPDAHGMYGGRMLRTVIGGLPGTTRSAFPAFHPLDVQELLKKFRSNRELTKQIREVAK